jgi:hypothetical protein
MVVSCRKARPFVLSTKLGLQRCKDRRWSVHGQAMESARSRPLAHRNPLCQQHIQRSIVRSKPQWTAASMPAFAPVTVQLFCPKMTDTDSDTDSFPQTGWAVRCSHDRTDPRSVKRTCSCRRPRSRTSTLGGNQLPMPLGDDFDGVVGHLHGGLIVNRVCRPW